MAARRVMEGRIVRDGPLVRCRTRVVPLMSGHGAAGSGGEAEAVGNPKSERSLRLDEQFGGSGSFWCPPSPFDRTGSGLAGNRLDNKEPGVRLHAHDGAANRLSSTDSLRRASVSETRSPPMSSAHAKSPRG